MERKPLVAANWKMNKTVPESVDFVQEFLQFLAVPPGVEVILAPPFTSLAPVGKALRGSPVGLAAQNMHWEEAGAYTGEISPIQLRDLGCRYVLLGHSERRNYFAEGDGEISQKVSAALREGLIPILCVGETLGEKDYGKTLEVIERQIGSGTQDADLEDGTEMVLAYEPVWAIGTGKTAKPEEAQEVHRFMRGMVASLFGGDVSGGMRIIYGGSVSPENTAEIMEMDDVDGVLVGGASLVPEIFARIVKSAAKNPLDTAADQGG